MESKNYELAQLNGHLEYTERKVNETLQEKEERSILNDEKCNQLKNILIKLEDEVKMHSSRAQKAEDNVDLVAILKALVEEKAIELRSRDKLNEVRFFIKEKSLTHTYFFCCSYYIPTLVK